MSNILILCTDKVISEEFLSENILESIYFGNPAKSYFTVLKDQSFWLNDCKTFNYAYFLNSPIYFELEKETTAVSELCVTTKELLLWLHSIVKSLLKRKFNVKLIKASYGNDDNNFIYEQNMELGYLLQEEVIFDSYVLYCFS